MTTSDDTRSALSGTIETLAGDGSEPVVVNLGPQHPSTHGVFRLKVTLDGEIVKDAEMKIGYLHRSMEKLAEERTYTQNIPFTDRIDYLAAMSNNLAYCLAGRGAARRRGTAARAGDPRAVRRAPAGRLTRDGERHVHQRLWRLAHAAVPHVPRPRAGARHVRDDLRRATDDQLHADRRRRL